MNNLLQARFDDGEGEGTVAPDQHRRGDWQRRWRRNRNDKGEGEGLGKGERR
jgi:hypothetical protein